MISRRPAALLAGLGIAAIATLLLALASGSADISVGEVLDGTARQRRQRDIRDRGRPPPVARPDRLRDRRPAGGGGRADAGAAAQPAGRTLHSRHLGRRGGRRPVRDDPRVSAAWSSISRRSAARWRRPCWCSRIARGTGSWAPARLLLTGVVLAAGFSAATTLLLALSPDNSLRGMLFWLMGDFSYALRARPQPGACSWS